MERFSIEVSPRRAAAGRDAKTLSIASPCKFTNRMSPAEQASDMRNPELRRPLDLAPLSDD